MKQRVTTAITADDIADLMESIVATRWRANDDSYWRVFEGAMTIRWVECWNETNGWWRRGNPYAYHQWGYGER